MNQMTRWGATWLVSCGLLGGCTEEANFQAISAEQSALETTHFVNAQNLDLRLAPTDEAWVADPVDDSNAVSNFKAVVLRAQKATRLRIEGEWAEYQLENGVTGWAQLSAWESGATWFAGTNVQETELCLDLSCSETKTLPPLTLMLVNSKATAGMNPIRFETSRGFIKSEALELDDESVFFAFQVVRAEWSRANANLENNGRILDKARIKYPESKYLDTLGERIPFADYSKVPHVDTSDAEALELLKLKAQESLTNQ